MNKLNFLPKLGLGTTIGLLFSSVSIFVVSEASAANFPDTSCASGLASELPTLDPVECGDKVFSGFEVSSTIALPADANYSIQIAQNQFLVNLDTGVDAVSGPFTAELSYMIEIVDNLGGQPYVFNQAALDDTTTNGTVVTKEIATMADFSDAITLRSENGADVPLRDIQMVKKIFVRDTAIISENGTLSSIENSFTQKKTAPEPGTILGVLAFSGLGLGLKRKKQS